MLDFWLMADQDDWLSVKRAATHVNRTIKRACVNVSEKFDSAANASIKTDLLCDNFETFGLVWERAVKTFQAARNEFAKAARDSRRRLNEKLPKQRRRVDKRGFLTRKTRKNDVF